MKLLRGLCFVVVALSLTGCDKISEIMQYFSKSNEEKPAAEIPVPAAPSETTPRAPAAAAPANALAQVGNWSITKEEFEERLTSLKQFVQDPNFDVTNFETKRLILDELVRQQLVIIDAEQSGLNKQKEVVDAVEEFRRTLLVREMIRKITEAVSISEEDAKKYFDENKESIKAAITEPMEWRLREIVLDSQLKAAEILAEVLKGNISFEDAAKQNSISKSAANGGDLGSLAQFPFPQMEPAIASLNKGDVSSVFKGPDGYYIVKVEEKRGGREKAFDEVKSELIPYLTQLEQQKVILDYINQLKEKTAVKVNEDLLK